MTGRARDLSAVLLIVAFVPTIALGETISIGQVDNFQAGTTQGWRVGPPHPNPPTIVSNDGPDGVGDGYLKIIATGGIGPGSRLGVFNDSRWAGNLLAGGITAISADLSNLGNSSLEIRLMLEHANGTQFLSAEGFPLPPQGGWQSASFALGADDLNRVQGTSSLDTVLGNVHTLWIFHNGDPSFPPQRIIATLGIDNVTAVPEPGTMVLCGLGAMMFLAYNRRRRRIIG